MITWLLLGWIPSILVGAVIGLVLSQVGLISNDTFWITPLTAFVWLGPVAFKLYQWLQAEHAQARAANDARLKAEQDSKRARAEAQRLLESEMNARIRYATETVSKLPTLIGESEAALDLAESEFADGAFAPFWEAVETASTRLAQHSFAIEEVENAAQEYRTLRSDFRSNPPVYNVPTVFPDPSSTVRRMYGIVRKAQRDFQYSAIYEQRKTNQILMEGFAHLSGELGNLGDRFERSIELMGGSVVEAIEEAANVQATALDQILEKVSSSIEIAHSDALESQKQQADALAQASLAIDDAITREIDENRQRRNADAELSRLLNDIHEDIHRRR